MRQKIKCGLCDTFHLTSNLIVDIDSEKAATDMAIHKIQLTALKNIEPISGRLGYYIMLADFKRKEYPLIGPSSLCLQIGIPI